MTAATLDPYAILGVDRSATHEHIRRAYYRIALETRPDLADSSRASIARFMRAAEAYEILGDPEARKRYDANPLSFRSGPERAKTDYPTLVRTQLEALGRKLSQAELAQIQNISNASQVEVVRALAEAHHPLSRKPKYTLADHLPWILQISNFREADFARDALLGSYFAAHSHEVAGFLGALKTESENRAHAMLKALGSAREAPAGTAERLLGLHDDTALEAGALLVKNGYWSHLNAAPSYKNPLQIETLTSLVEADVAGADSLLKHPFPDELDTLVQDIPKLQNSFQHQLLRSIIEDERLRPLPTAGERRFSDAMMAAIRRVQSTEHLKAIESARKRQRYSAGLINHAIDLCPRAVLRQELPGRPSRLSQ